MNAVENPVTESAEGRGPGALRTAVILILGLAAASCGSIFAKLAQEAPALTVAFYRMFGASVVLFPFYMVTTTWRRQEGSAEHGSPVGLAWWAFAGTALALHFAFWIGSLYYTTVAVSVLLVNTAPIFAVLLSYRLFGERLTRSGWCGIVLAFLGAVVLAGNDVVRFNGWRGPLLASLGAAMFGMYLVAGRSIRTSRGLLPYVYPTYALAALILLVFVLAGGYSVTGFQASTYCFMALLGVVPQSIGHTSYNWALRYLPATLVGMLVMGEPLGASALAYWILREEAGWAVIAGGCSIVAGIYLVAAQGIRRPPAKYVEGCHALR